MKLNPLKIGVQNLILNCAELSSSDTLLVVLEDPELGWYKKDIAELVVEEASRIGIKVRLVSVSSPTNDGNKYLTSIIEKYKCVIFFARIGDQDRFGVTSYKARRVMSYARSNKDLASSFGTVNYKALKELKNNIDELIVNSRGINIYCPNGTSITCKPVKLDYTKPADVNVVRFPVVVPAPILAEQTTGKVVLDGFLTPTGSKVYSPPSIPIESKVEVFIINGRIEGFHGHRKTIKKIKSHYDRIAKKFNIGRDIVHSWHAGIHPGVIYEEEPENNPDRWANTMFASPKFLHFHTCGSYAPGEICWMIKNPSILIDGVPLWKNGELQPQLFKKTRNCIEQWSDLQKLFPA